MTLKYLSNSIIAYYPFVLSLFFFPLISYYSLLLHSLSPPFPTPLPLPPSCDSSCLLRSEGQHRAILSSDLTHSSTSAQQLDEDSDRTR